MATEKPDIIAIACERCGAPIEVHRDLFSNPYRRILCTPCWATEWGLRTTTGTTSYRQSGGHATDHGNTELTQERRGR